MRYRYLIVIFFLTVIFGCKTPMSTLFIRESNWAEKVSVKGFDNLYKIDAVLYRSEQPNSAEMILLDSIGVKTIINLRNIKTDNHEAKNTSLKLIHIPINTWTISYDDVVMSMIAIMNAKAPILIHCKHGSDRTGCVVAVYRMVKFGWSKEQAISEFRKGGFGFHEKCFPNILKLLNTINIEQIKKDIEIKSLTHL